MEFPEVGLGCFGGNASRRRQIQLVDLNAWAPGIHLRFPQVIFSFIILSGRDAFPAGSIVKEYV